MAQLSFLLISFQKLSCIAGRCTDGVQCTYNPSCWGQYICSYSNATYVCARFSHGHGVRYRYIISYIKCVINIYIQLPYWQYVMIIRFIDRKRKKKGLKCSYSYNNQHLKTPFYNKHKFSDNESKYFVLLLLDQGLYS